MGCEATRLTPRSTLVMFDELSHSILGSIKFVCYCLFANE